MDVLPNTLEEAIDILKIFYSKNLEQIAKMDEEKFLSSLHFRDGMFIRNSWVLWWHKNHVYSAWPKDQPKLNAWFESIDIVHADDMSSIILTCFHRNLTGKEYDIQSQVDKYKKHWIEQGYPDGIPKN